MWPRFAEVVGDDAESRALFDRIASDPKNLELLEKAEELLKKSDAPDADADALFAVEKLYLARRDELNKLVEQGQAPPLAAIHGWMYLGTYPRTDHPAKASKFLDFLPKPAKRDPDPAGFIRDLTGASGTPVRRLLAAWTDRQRSNASGLLGLEFAVKYDIKEALAPARHVLAECAGMRPEEVNGPTIGVALQIVGRHGAESDLPVVVKYLGHTQVFSGHKPGEPVRGEQPDKLTDGKHISTQIRDVAAVVMIVLRKGKPEDFRFIWTKTEAKKLVPWADTLGTDPLDAQIIGFSTEADREAAHKKARAWLDRQKK